MVATKKKITRKKKVVRTKRTLPLTVYRKKRHFEKTPEPSGSRVIDEKRVYEQKALSRAEQAAIHKISPIFVVQEHDASHLHYDFRFEYKGVLKSWAIPKGISSELGVKHLAIQTEDHPMGYARFEGIIPPGEYGAGTVMVWDIGTFRNIKMQYAKPMTMDECLKKGRIELWLDGQKLQGGYVLIRTKLRDTAEVNWLMFKKDDEFANKPFKKKNKSVLSGKTMKQITESGKMYQEEY